MKTFFKILVGIIMAPLALALLVLAGAIFIIAAAMNFAYGDIEFELEEDKKAEEK
jgi:hypothetical protein